MNRADRTVAVVVALAWVAVGGALVARGGATEPQQPAALAVPLTSITPTSSSLPTSTSSSSSSSVGTLTGQATASAAVTLAPSVKPTPRVTAKASPRPKSTSKSRPRPTATSKPTSFANCTALRKVYPGGVSSSHPAYRGKMDRDHDGWACER